MLQLAATVGTNTLSYRTCFERFWRVRNKLHSCSWSASERAIVICIIPWHLGPHRVHRRLQYTKNVVLSLLTLQRYVLR